MKNVTDSDSILYFTFENQTHELNFITFAHMAARPDDLLPLGHQTNISHLKEMCLHNADSKS